MKKDMPRPLGDVLKKVVRNLGKKRLAEEELVKAWQGAAGKRAAAHTRLVGLRKTKLIVNVDSSAWLYDLTLKKRAILKKVQEKAAAGGKIKDMRLRIGDIKR